MLLFSEIVCGECDRHVYDHRLLACVRRYFPERNSLATIDDARSRKRNEFLCRDEDTAACNDGNHQQYHAGRSPSQQKKRRDDGDDREGNAAEHDRIFFAEGYWFFRFVERGENRKVVFRIAPEKVEDAGATGIDAGGERRPRHGRLRRQRRAQRAKRPLRAQLGEVRKLPFVHPLLRVAGVDAVEAEDDDFLLIGAGDQRKHECHEQDDWFETHRGGMIAGTSLGGG